MIEPVGVNEIAQRLGVKRNTVSMWRIRGIFPDPQWHCSGIDLWDWEVVATWQAQRRLYRRRASA